MDFDLGEDQRRWHDAALAFAREALDPDAPGRDARGEFWREGWRLCAEFGIQGLPIPAKYGGGGGDLASTIAAMEGLGRGCGDAGLLFAINASMWTNSIPILTYGTEAQKRRWLPGLCDGTVVGANGASEPEAGSDIFAMSTTGVWADDRWLLDGRKTWVTSAPVAELFVCYARTEPIEGAMGISAFLVPADAPGFRVVREIPKLGLRTAPMGEIAFERCELPVDALLGRRGRGGEVFRCSMEWERGAILASTLGAMRRQLDRCVQHARKRRQSGQPIGKFQAVAHKIADMHIRLEACRPLVYKIGWRKGRGEDASTDAAVAKVYVSECFVQNSLDAVQIFGASGYAVETGIERDLRDAAGGTLYSGTSEVQRNIIARALGL